MDERPAADSPDGARRASVAGRLLDVAGDSALRLGMLVAGFMSLAITFEVVMRYFFNAPTIWVSDASAYGLLWIAFLVGPWLTRQDGHIQMGLLSARLRPVTLARLRTVTALVTAAVLGLLCYLTATATVDSWTHGILTTSGSWEIPQALVWLVMPVGSLLMALEAVRLAARNLRAAGHPSDAAAIPPSRAMGIE